jgi:hypothetical protein
VAASKLLKVEVLEVCTPSTTISLVSLEERRQKENEQRTELLLQLLLRLDVALLELVSEFSKRLEFFDVAFEQFVVLRSSEWSARAAETRLRENARRKA